VREKLCLLSKLAAADPATPPELVVVLPNKGREPTTPLVTVVDVLEVESPSRYD